MSEAIETAPEAASTGGDFFSSIEAAFNAAEAPVEIEQAPAPEPDSGTKPGESSTVEDVPSIEEGTEPESTLPIDEEAPEPSNDDQEELGGKAGRRFKQIKNELKQSNTELLQVRQQLEERDRLVQELQSRTRDSEEVEQTIAQYEQALAITKLESTKAYQNEVQAPMVRIVETVDTIAAKYEIDSDELIEVLSYSDRDRQDDALDNLLQGVKERDKLAIYALAEQVPLIVARKQLLSENAAEALAELEQIDSEQAKQELARTYELRQQAAQQVHDKLISKVPFLKTIEDLDFSNVTKRAGDTDFDGLDLHNKVYSKIAGDMLPKIVREFASLRSELEEALDELESFKKSSPKTGSGSASGTGQTTRASGSFVDAINAALGG
jgi:tetratricopeptide (TPR) repeat protein